MLPVTTVPAKEHGIELDYDKIIKFVEKIEPEILKLEVDKGHYNEEPGTVNEMIIKWNGWNILFAWSSVIPIPESCTVYLINSVLPLFKLSIFKSKFSTI